MVSWSTSCKRACHPHLDCQIMRSSPAPTEHWPCGRHPGGKGVPPSPGSHAVHPARFHLCGDGGRGASGRLVRSSGRCGCGKLGAGSPAIHAAPQVALCYALYEARSSEAGSHLVNLLDQAGIDSLFWYGRGLPAHPAYAALPSDPLPNTISLSGKLIGLPSFVDLPQARIARILKEIVKPAEAAERDGRPSGRHSL